MDELRIDSHKLMYHVDRVNQWEKGKTVSLIYRVRWDKLPSKDKTRSLVKSAAIDK